MNNYFNNGILKKEKVTENLAAVQIDQNVLENDKS